MPFFRKKYKQNLKKYPYSFKCGKTRHIGYTDDPLRTLTSHWKIYKHCEKWFSLDRLLTHKEHNYNYDLVIYEDKDKNVKYTYKNEEITKFKFRELLDGNEKFDKGN